MTDYYNTHTKSTAWTDVAIAVAGAAGTVGAAYFSPSPASNVPAPTYNIIGSHPSMGAQNQNPYPPNYYLTNPTQKSESKILGMEPALAVMLIIAVLAVLGFAAFYFLKK